MGKRDRAERSLLEVSELAVSRHACRRYRQRVKCVSYRDAAEGVLAMLRRSQPVIRSGQQDDVQFFSADGFVIVVGRDGLVRTLYRERDSDKPRKVLAKQRRDETRKRERTARRRERHVVGRYGYRKTNGFDNQQGGRRRGHYFFE